MKAHSVEMKNIKTDQDSNWRMEGGAEEKFRGAFHNNEEMTFFYPVKIVFFSPACLKMSGK